MRQLLLLFPLVFILAPEHNRQGVGASAPIQEDYRALPRKTVNLEGTVFGVLESVMPRSARQRLGSWWQGVPVAFLEASIARYDREVTGYRVTLVKRERTNGVLQPLEKVDAWFREKPFSVHMEWLLGERLAKRVLYVEGENKDKLLVMPAGLLALVGIREYEPDSSDAKASSRYPATEFGIRKGTVRTLHYWKLARERGDLDVRYEGVVEVPELAGRPCWKLRRLYAAPECDGITEAIFYFDTANGLQVGSILLDAKGELIGKYFFRDLQRNPQYPAGLFTRAGLRR